MDLGVDRSDGGDRVANFRLSDFAPHGSCFPSGHEIGVKRTLPFEVRAGSEKLSRGHLGFLMIAGRGNVDRYERSKPDFGTGVGQAVPFEENGVPAVRRDVGAENCAETGAAHRQSTEQNEGDQERK